VKPLAELSFLTSLSFLDHCFATDRSKAVTPRVLILVNCFGVCFEIGHFINHALSYSLLLGCVGRLCLLNVEIPDMDISFVFNIKHFDDN
jgi:hypothetical protein